VDNLCRSHDIAYDGLNSSSNPAADRLAADTALINGTAELLASGQLSDRDAALAFAVLVAFEGKLGLYDVPAWLLESFQNLLEALAGRLAQIGGAILDVVVPSAHASQDPSLNDHYRQARGWIRRDPLAIDLDGDGIETVGVDAGVLFDHNADGIETGTGWLKGDDAFLVIDRNGNGVIDSGRELFGVDTVVGTDSQDKPIYATDGFDALKSIDSNGDGVFNASDAQYANVCLWQDSNQDGVSQANELISLSDAGITGIDLTVEFHSNLTRGFHLNLTHPVMRAV
jgi:hypothetical protein